MTVTTAVFVCGRGPVAAVERAPRDMRIGVLVHQGEHAWKVTGIERHHSSVDRETDHHYGLVLRAEAGAPQLPELGDLEL